MEVEAINHINGVAKTTLNEGMLNTLSQELSSPYKDHIHQEGDLQEGSSVQAQKEIASAQSSLTAIMNECVDKAKSYPTLNALLTFHRSQGKRLIESFAIASALGELSYIYCHSYEVKEAGQINGMSLNLFVALFADTGYGKSYCLDAGRDFVIDSCINNTIKESLNLNSDEYFSTELPASKEGMQRDFRLFPVRAYVKDEAADILLSKNSFKQETFDTLKSLFSPYKFNTSSTKKKENENKESHDKCIAVIIMGGPTKDMQRGLLSDVRAENGTANRFLLVCPSSYRTSSGKPKKLSETELTAIKNAIQAATKQHIKYENKTSSSDELQNEIRRIVENIYCDAIEMFFEEIESEIADKLDDKEMKGEPMTPELLQFTRTGVIKKRLAYLLWLEKGLSSDWANQCAIDACFLVDALYQTAVERKIFEQSYITADNIVKKILSLEGKKKAGQEIYLSNLTGKNQILDLGKHGNDLEKIIKTIRHLDSIGKIKVTSSQSSEKGIKFVFIDPQPSGN